jgi:hypothetical protein
VAGHHHKQLVFLALPSNIHITGLSKVAPGDVCPDKGSVQDRFAIVKAVMQVSACIHVSNSTHSAALLQMSSAVFSLVQFYVQ